MLWAIAAVVVASFLLVVLRGAPYVPSRKADVARAFDEVYQLRSSDLLVDIGAGDGVVCRMAAAQGARAVGFEINPFLVLLARWLGRHQPRASVRLADFWHATVPEGTTIVYTFGESRDVEKMAAWVERQATALGRPLFFLSYAFELRSRKALRGNGTHYLYQIEPLQRRDT